MFIIRCIARLPLLTLVASLSGVAAEPRAWMDESGKHHAVATLADFQHCNAYLKKTDGKIVEVPFGKLSIADREFINESIKPVKIIRGKVASITDGDTLIVLEGNEPRRIRLEGIDAPETHQAFGTRAKDALAEKVFHKTVFVEWRDYDKYNRVLGHIFVDDHWINREIVQDGMAWHFKKYSKSLVLADAETEAREAKRGLWAGDSPTPPWDFRHVASTARKLSTKPPERFVEKPVALTDREPLASVPPAASTSPSHSAPSARKSSGDGPVHVHGYYRKDGKYVQPYTRSRPHRR